MNSKIKLLIISIFIIIISINIVGAGDGECEQQQDSNSECPLDNTPESLKKYLKNIDKILGKISSSSKEESNVEGEINRYFDWNLPQNNFHFKTEEQKNEIIKQVKRDVKKLKQKYDKIKISNYKYGEKEYSGKELCEGLGEDCMFDKDVKYKAIEVATDLKQSLARVRAIVENKATENDYSGGPQVEYGLGKKLKAQLKKDYSKKQQKKCDLKNGFLGDVAKFLKKTQCIDNKANKGKNEFKDASYKEQKLGPYKVPEDRKKDKEKLEKECKKNEGLGGEQQCAIKNNGKNHNKKKPEKKEATTLDEAIAKVAEKKCKGDKICGDAWVRKTAEKIRKDHNTIERSIADTYKNRKDLSLASKNSATNPISKLGKSSYEMLESIHYMDTAKKDAKKTCESYSAGRGPCEQ